MAVPRSEARAQGLGTEHRPRTAYVAVHRNVYVPRGAELDPVQKAVAAWLWSGRRAVLAGLSAGALHGMRWIDADPKVILHRARQALVQRGLIVEKSA